MSEIHFPKLRNLVVLETPQDMWDMHAGLPNFIRELSETHTFLQCQLEGKLDSLGHLIWTLDA